MDDKVDFTEAFIDCYALSLGFYEIEQSSPRAFGRVTKTSDNRFKVEIVAPEMICAMNTSLSQVLRFTEMSQAKKAISDYLFKSKEARDYFRRKKNLVFYITAEGVVHK
jgi:hypothetical protein